MAGLITQSVDHLQFDRYMSVAGAMVWVYDYLLTVSEEVTLIWPRKLSLVKLLYFANRYVSPPYIAVMMYYFLGRVTGTVDQMRDMCRFINIAIIILRQVEVVSGTWLITIRVLVLYARIKWVKWTLYTAFIITHGVTFGLMGNVIWVIYPKVAYVTQLRLCVSPTTPEVTKILYFLQIPFEFILLGFLLYHSWQFNRTIMEPANLKRNPLLSALYTDGVLYFVGIIASRVWAGCIVLIFDPTYWYMTIVMDLCLSTIFISRIFIHLSVVSDSTTTTLAGTSWNGAVSKQSIQLNVYPPSQNHAQGSEGGRTGSTLKPGSHPGGRARISWTEMGRTERPQRDRDQYDSIMEDP